MSTWGSHNLFVELNCICQNLNASLDFRQTSGFIRALKPPHVILVHGEANEMNRLKNALIREYEAEPQTKVRVGLLSQIES